MGHRLPARLSGRPDGRCEPASPSPSSDRSSPPWCSPAWARSCSTGLGPVPPTESELRDQAEGLADARPRRRSTGRSGVRRPALARVLRAFELEGIDFVFLDRQGRVVGRPPQGVGDRPPRPGPAAGRRDPERPRRRHRLRAGPRPGRPGRARRGPHPVGRPRAGPGVPVVRALGGAHPRRRGGRRGAAQPGAHRPPAGGRGGHPPDRGGRPEHPARRAAATGPATSSSDLTRSINTMAEGLERSRGLEQQFLLSVSHDLRTPLTSIRGYAEAIGDGTGSSPSRRPGSSCRRRSGSNGWWPTCSTWPASTPAGSASSCARPTSAGSWPPRSRGSGRPPSGPGVALDVADDRIAARVAVVDPDRLGQVVANLVDNGCRHAAGRVRVTTAADADAVVVAVEDDGGGIAAGGPAPRVRAPLRGPAPARPTGVGLGPGARHRARAGRRRWAVRSGPSRRSTADGRHPPVGAAAPLRLSAMVRRRAAAGHRDRGGRRDRALHVGEGDRARPSS